MRYLGWRGDVIRHSSHAERSPKIYPERQIHSQFAKQTMSVKLMSLVMCSVQNKKRGWKIQPLVAPRTGLEPVTS